MNPEEQKKWVNKSDRQLFTINMITGFELPKLEAEALRDYYDGSRGPGQITRCKSLCFTSPKSAQWVKFTLHRSVDFRMLYGKTGEAKKGDVKNKE